MRNDDANQAMMMGAGAAVTMASCANNAVDSSLEFAAVVCNESNSGFGVFFGLLTFVIPPLAGYLSWDWGLSAEGAALVVILAAAVWLVLWSRLFTSDGRSAADSDEGFGSEGVE